MVNVSEVQTRPLRVKEYSKEHDEARVADEDFTKRKKAYQDANIEAIDRVLKAERANGKLAGRDAEVQAAWAKWREETQQHAKRISDARTKLSAERGVAELSLFDPRPDRFDVSSTASSRPRKSPSTRRSCRLAARRRTSSWSSRCSARS